MEKQKSHQVGSTRSQTVISSQHELLPPQKEIQDPSQIEINFGFNVSISQITDLFEQIAQQFSNYDMIQKEFNHATAIRQNKKTIMQMLNCFNWWGQTNMTAIKMTIHTSEKNSKRVCRIRGLVGSKREVRIFINAFNVKSKQLMSSSVSFVENDDMQADIAQQLSNPFHLQTCAAYMFHKILSNSQYGIGSIIQNSLKNFKQAYKDPLKSADSIPIPMKTLKQVCEYNRNLVNEIVENLYKQFNYGKKQTEQIMPYCRISVEKYIFEHIYDILFPLYVQRSRKNEEIYNEKKKIIFNQLTLKEIFEEINLNPVFWPLIICGDVQVSLNTKKSSSDHKKNMKISRCISELQKILYTKNPRQKIKYCQLMYTHLKATIFELTNGKSELNNMEDIIPFMILTILIVDVPNLKAQIDISKDFAAYDICDMESQNRMLINLTESFNYVVRDWKL